MIYRDRYGCMHETDMISDKPQPAQSDYPRFYMDAEAMNFARTMAPEDRVHGLCENARGIGLAAKVFGLI